MLGPIFVREATVIPKRVATYLGRFLYVLALFLLLCTGYLVLDGSRTIASASDSARFGGWMFTLLAPLQWLVLTAIAAVGAASSVAQEKDRRTLILLLLTRLSGWEVVAGKLMATLLTPMSMLLCALPLFLSLPLLGGVSPLQVLGVFVVTAASLLLAATVGTVVGLWREKTFQAIAMTLLILLMYVGLGEVVAGWIASGQGPSGEVPGVQEAATWNLTDGDETLALAISPLRSLGAAASPMAALSTQTAIGIAMFVALTLLASATLLVIGVKKVRVWNPSREVRIKPPEAETSTEASEIGQTQQLAQTHWKVRQPRPVWNNPVLWREVRTWAYGRKVVVIRVAFLLLFLLSAGLIFFQIQDGSALQPAGRIGRSLPAVTLPLSAISVISLVLINALAANSVTGERDGLALDLLLVTDLSPKEFVFGKMLGVFYVGKELILLPLALIFYLATMGVVTIENAFYLAAGSLVLCCFVAMLGIHSGLNHVASRTATLSSLGTVFFLCVGIAICMTIMVSFRGAFQLQLAPFLVMILGGGAALFAALGWRNPSSAIFLASFTLPLITFYAITQFLLQVDHLYVFFAITVGYVFTIAAIMIPALSEFDVSLDRDRGSSSG